MTTAIARMVSMKTGEVQEIEYVPPVEPTPDPAVVLAAWRETAFIDKATFLLRSADAGLITDQEAVDGAQGIWPTSFDAALAGLTGKKPRDARVVFAGAVNIHRNNEFVAVVQAFKQLTDEQVDALFL